jgi:predicted GIY-YIG superfamily endonuclease
MIYVLLLQENKFYVGYSERSVGERFIDHLHCQGSTLYRPVQVLEVHPGGIEEENVMTLRIWMVEC